MIVQRSLDVLEVINLDLNRKDMVVLGALLKAQNELTSYVDFVSLREQLEKDEGGRKGKDSLIYRSLSWLEQAGLIQIDRSGHKHGYNSSVGLIHKFMIQAIKERVSILTKELRLLDSEIQAISDMNPEVLTSDMIAQVAGTQPIDRPIFAQGWQNILKLMDNKIYQRLKKKDIVRFTLEWYNHPEVLEEPRLVNLESLLKRGVEFRGLEHGKLERKVLLRLAERFEYYRKSGYSVGFHIFLREDSTYQFVARNTEGIILIVSENPLSATWLPRSTNAELVDNAIQSFDQDYTKGSDISNYGS